MRDQKTHREGAKNAKRATLVFLRALCVLAVQFPVFGRGTGACSTRWPLRAINKTRVHSCYSRIMTFFAFFAPSRFNEI